MLARRHDIPFYFACSLSTMDLNTDDGSAIPIAERVAKEVTGFRDCQWAAQGPRVRNLAFDVTPADFVTGLISEKGVVHQPSREKLEALFL